MDDAQTKIYIEKIFNAKLDGLEREMKARLNGMDQAQSLLKTENERRFHELNALRREYTENRTEDGRKLVTWETYNPKVKEMDVWREWATKELTTITTKSAVWTGAIGVFFTILMLFINFWVKK